MKYNVIQHITTFCNYDCTYCDVIKDWRNVSKANQELIKSFIRKNHQFINKYKFFWWEPLLRWKDIKDIIDCVSNIIWSRFELVTNTVFLNSEIGEYFDKFFEIVFFSIDSENEFDYIKVFNFIDKFKLENKVYFNIIISPWKEYQAYSQFLKLYNNWYKNYNILPVYYTKKWSKHQLLCLSKVLKIIVDASIDDPEINLYWFQLNNWYNNSLMNDSLFIDTDANLYYTDFVSTFYGKNIQDALYLWHTWDNIWLDKLNLSCAKNALQLYEQNLIKSMMWQKQLHSLMDYFSVYLNARKNES